MTNFNEHVLTFDTDWAPDWMIDDIADVLIKNKVRSTWFITHGSAAVERLRKRPDLFELGIHPNCHPGSTHGKTDEEVLRHMLNLLPNTMLMRTHALYQSTWFLINAARNGINIDVSLFLPRSPNLIPHRLRWHGINLWRVPYFWEDDSEFFEDRPIWKLSDERLKFPGLKVFDFHPVHVVLNTVNFDVYQQLKGQRNLTEWTPEFIDAVKNHGSGPRSLFLELVEHLKGGGTWIKNLVS